MDAAMKEAERAYKTDAKTETNRNKQTKNMKEKETERITLSKKRMKLI
jgi:hypothetical protein